MSLHITPLEAEELQKFRDKKDYINGWKYLASIGDRYADNAYSVTTGISLSNNLLDRIYDELMYNFVLYYWYHTAGPDAYPEKFSIVAQTHFDRYTEITIDQNGKLPDTSQIEASYRLALEKNDLPATVAIDGALTSTIGELFDHLYPGLKNKTGIGLTDWI